MIENPLYQGMSLKNLLETTDLFQIPGLILDENGVNKDSPAKKDGSDMYKSTAAFLGPDIWDNSQKMSFEYMDLDEFLNENNIPVELCMSPDASDQQQEQEQQHQKEQSVSPTPMSPSKTLGMVMSGNASPMIGRVSSPISSDEDSMQFINPITIEHQDINIKLPELDSLPAESPRVPPIRTENSNFVIKVKSKPDIPVLSVPVSSVPQVLPMKKLVNVPFSVEETDLALATVPGIDFDPRKRAFTDEELKPQPMIKKSRKQYVPEDLKDEHYWERRNKNNYAAKRSREARRLKENQIAMRANYLEKENAALTHELAKYKTELSLLKKRLAMYEKCT